MVWNAGKPTGKKGHSTVRRGPRSARGSHGMGRDMHRMHVAGIPDDGVPQAPIVEGKREQAEERKKKAGRTKYLGRTFIHKQRIAV